MGLDPGDNSFPQALLLRLEEGDLPVKSGQDGKGCLCAQGTNDLDELLELLLG